MEKFSEYIDALALIGVIIGTVILFYRLIEWFTDLPSEIGIGIIVVVAGLAWLSRASWRGRYS